MHVQQQTAKLRTNLNRHALRHYQRRDRTRTDGLDDANLFSDIMVAIDDPIQYRAVDGRSVHTPSQNHAERQRVPSRLDHTTEKTVSLAELRQVSAHAIES